MFKKMKISILVASFIIVLFNITSIPVLIGIEPLIHVYHYENGSGKELMEVPEKGTFVNFKEPGLKRKFIKNYLKFWNWYKYISHPRWKVEYYE